MVQTLIRLASTGLIVSISACLGVDLVAPAPYQPSASITLRQRADTMQLVQLTVIFHPGMNDGGMPRFIPDKNLLIDGATVRPSSSFDGFERYDRSFPLPATPSGARYVSVTLPAVPEGKLLPVTVTLPVIRRVGPRDVAFNPATGLSLDYDLDVSAMSPDEARWNLRLGAPCGPGVPFAALDVLGVPPKPVTVPRIIIDPGAHSDFEACLRFSWHDQLREAPYTIAVVVSAELEWHLFIDGAPVLLAK